MSDSSDRGDTGEGPFAAAIGTVAIVGAGQIGTALGMALRGRPGVGEILLFDRDPSAVRASLERGAGDRPLDREEDVPAADVVVLALPIAEILAFLERRGPDLRPGTLVIDTGSSKRAVVEAMARSLPVGAEAVGGHPVAGTERSGPAGAPPGLLRGAPFVLTPVGSEVPERAVRLVHAAGAVPLELDAETHDRLLARTSHLPHLCAAALAIAAAGAGPKAPSVAGPGFADATRLAGSDPAMVAGFLSANAAEVRAAVDEVRSTLNRLVDLLDDPARLAAALEDARRARDGVLR